MPPKKKKVVSQAPESTDEDQELVDVFSYLDLVEDCLDRAESSQTACLEGILKADITLTHIRGDADIGFIVLVKRAELLYIAVKHNYDVRDLSEKHSNPLASCIRDCETILKSVSSDDQASKSIYEKAKSLYTSAMQFKKASQPASRAQATVEQPKESQRVFQQYNPTKTLFKHISKINPYLLQDVVNCYRNSKLFCQRCYYKHRRHEQLASSHHCKKCKRSVQPLIVMPASKMCQNLAQSKIVAIPTPPKTLMSKFNMHKPFQMCRNRDHSGCYEKLANGETWFAHCIEELVIWTVERHHDCTFKEYLAGHHEDSDAPNHSLFAPSSGGRVGGEQNRDHRSVSTDDTDYEYYPDECLFPDITSIPQRLLLDIIECYRLVREYCMSCFYKENEEGIVTVQRHSNSTICSICQRDWNSVFVIPASNLCWNFGELEKVPIAPWPRGKPSKEPFEYCRKSDHFRCFRVYVDTDFWYPHSVEEMVIWTVERERKCTFSQFIDSLSRLPPEMSGGSPKQSQPVVSSPSSSKPTANTPINTGLGTHVKQTQVQQTSLGPKSPSAQTNLQVSGKKLPQTQATDSVASRLFSTASASAKIPVTANAGLVLSPTAKLQANVGGAYVAGAPQAKKTLSPPANVSTTKTISSLGRNATISSQTSSSKKFLDMNVTPSNHSKLPNSGLFIDPKPQQSPAHSQLKLNSNGASLHSLASKPLSAHGPILITSGTIVSPREFPELKPKHTVSSANTFAGGLPNGFPNTTVIATAANSEPSGRPNYRIAPVLYGDGTSTTTTNSAPPQLTSQPVPQVFRFSEVNFKYVSDMPLTLLQGIAVSMREKMEVCRKCFYGDRTISHWAKTENVCSNGEHQWMNPIIVIPGCVLCDNEPCFKRGELVAIPPLPPVALIKKCGKKNHHKCFFKSMESNERVAHSVEELVIWIVESEMECSFEQYAIHELHIRVNRQPPTTPINNDAPLYHPPVQPPSIPPPQAVTQNVVPTLPPVSQDNSSKLVKVKTSTVAVSDMTTKLLTLPPYSPKGTEFTSIKDIPIELLRSVAGCYHHRMLVCRICFFDSNCKTLSSRKEEGGECEYGHTPWKQVIVIPASALCISPSEYVPIPPLPKHMKHSNASFAVCKKKEHHTCYAMSKGTNPWFPHTVEELVIWTVEREKETSFEDVYKEFMSDLASEATGSAYRQRHSSQPQLSSSGTTTTQLKSYIDSVPSFNPSRTTPLDFSNTLQSPALNFEDAVSLASSSAQEPTKYSTATKTNAKLPLHQGRFDFPSFAAATQYNYPSAASTTVAPPKNPVDLGVMPELNPSDPAGHNMTTNDALEYFPALLGSGNSSGGGVGNTESSSNPLLIAGNPVGSYGFMSAFGMDQNSFQSEFTTGRQNPARGQNVSASQIHNEAALHNWNRALSENQIGGSITQRVNTKVPPPSQSHASQQSVMERNWGVVIGQPTPSSLDPLPPGFESMSKKSSATTKQGNTAGNSNSTLANASPLGGTHFSTAVGSALVLGADWPELLDSRRLEDSSNKDDTPYDLSGIDLPRMPNSEPLVLENVTKQSPNGKAINGGSSNTSKGKRSNTSASKTKNGRNGSKQDSIPLATTKGQAEITDDAQSVDKPRSNSGLSVAVQNLFDIAIERDMAIESAGSISEGNSVSENEVRSSASTSGEMSKTTELQSHTKGAVFPENDSTYMPSSVSTSGPPPDSIISFVQGQLDTFESEAEDLSDEESVNQNGDDQDPIVTETEQRPMQLFMPENDLTTKSSLFASVMAAQAGPSGPVSPIVKEDKEGGELKDSTKMVSSEGAAIFDTMYREPENHSEHLVIGSTEVVGVSEVDTALDADRSDISENMSDTDSASASANAVQSSLLEENAKEVVQFEPNNAPSLPVPGGLRGIEVSVSDPIAAEDGSGFVWKATLRGQDLKNLCGVYCCPKGSQQFEQAQLMFEITHIEGCATVIDVHGATWEPPQGGEPVVQGLVVLTITASSPPVTGESTEHECEVQVNVGFKEPLTFNLKLAGVQGNKEPLLITEPEPVINGIVDVPKLEEKLIQDSLPLNDPEVPAPKWDLLSMSSSSSDELGVPNIEGEDLTLQHVPIEDWGCSLTDDLN